jgi:hypothetical protein
MRVGAAAGHRRGTEPAQRGCRLEQEWLRQRSSIMADNKDPKQKQPGEKQEGKYHYKPGNQSGKELGIAHPENADEPKIENLHSGDAPRKRAS